MPYRSSLRIGRSAYGSSPDLPRRDRGPKVDRRSGSTAPALFSTASQRSSSSSLPALLFLIILLFLFILTVTGCSFDYGEAPGTVRPETPNLDLTGARYQAARSSEQSILFTADRLRIYDAKDRANMEGVTFTQYGAESTAAGEDVIATGSCRTAEISLSSNDADLEGSITIRSEQRGATLTAESLSWDHSRERLTSGPDERVTITFDDGTVVTGVGFIGRMDLNSYEFTESSEGSIVYE